MIFLFSTWDMLVSWKVSFLKLGGSRERQVVRISTKKGALPPAIQQQGRSYSFGVQHGLTRLGGSLQFLSRHFLHFHFSHLFRFTVNHPNVVCMTDPEERKKTRQVILHFVWVRYFLPVLPRSLTSLKMMVGRKMFVSFWVGQTAYFQGRTVKLPGGLPN